MAGRLRRVSRLADGARIAASGIDLLRGGKMRSITISLTIVAIMSATASHALAQFPSDQQMSQHIADSLKQSGRLKDYRVGVKYRDGVAWLIGSVTSEPQKQVAEQVALNCGGVDRVYSKLEISPPEMQAAQQRPIQRASSSNDRRFAQRPLRRQGAPVPFARQGNSVQPTSYSQDGRMQPAPMRRVPGAVGQSVSYENPQVPGYAWPSYAASPNYAALTYPKQYSPSAWPYIGPFYPYPQVPLGWRKVMLEWDDGWWFLDFKDGKRSY